MKVNRCVLDNRLRVVHVEMPHTQMVALNVVYDVGARDEQPTHTGFAHLMEHLMFGGSVNISDFDSPLLHAGGENNAWTNSDVTNYYLSIPHQNVETAFWLESDRMLGLGFSERSLQVQRSVVMEEFKQRCLNHPYGDVHHLLSPLAYKVHPYQWPVIGKELAHIEQTTLDDVRAFFARFYAPNNAVLSVTGCISWEEVQRLANKWFGPIPPQTAVQPRALPQEPEQQAERRLEVSRDVPIDALYMAFHVCGRSHPDFKVCDALSDVLGNGASSRLVSRLVTEGKVFSSLDAYVSATFDPGLLHISGNPAPGVSLEQAEEAVWRELDALCREPVGERELEKVKNKFESTHIFSHVNYQEVATNLAQHELLSTACDINNEVPLYRTLTAERLQAAARRVLRRENASVLYYKKG